MDCSLRSKIAIRASFRACIKFNIYCINSAPSCIKRDIVVDLTVHERLSQSCIFIESGKNIPFLLKYINNTGFYNVLIDINMELRISVLILVLRVFEVLINNFSACATDKGYRVLNRSPNSVNSLVSCRHSAAESKWCCSFRILKPSCKRITLV